MYILVSHVFLHMVITGTDATHAEHIEKIKDRMYVGLQDGSHFIPGNLGMGLVEGYDDMGFPMSKPHLRAELEADLKKICEGIKDPKAVLEEQLAKYKEVFRIAIEQVKILLTDHRPWGYGCKCPHILSHGTRRR